MHLSFLLHAFGSVVHSSMSEQKTKSIVEILQYILCMCKFNMKDQGLCSYKKKAAHNTLGTTGEVITSPKDFGILITQVAS